MRRDLLLAALLAPLALAQAGCGVSDSRYKAALDQVARRDAEAKAAHAQAEALAGKVAALERRLEEAERARRAAAADAATHRAEAAALGEARARLEADLDAALAESHRAAARLAEVAGNAAEPWRPRACSPLGALLREAGLCAFDGGREPGPVLVGGAEPAPVP